MEVSWGATGKRISLAVTTRQGKLGSKNVAERPHSGKQAKMITLYRVAAERTQTVIRSHDPRFMENLVDALEGKAIHPAVQDELRALARDLRDVLNGTIMSHIKEL